MPVNKRIEVCMHQTSSRFQRRVAMKVRTDHRICSMSTFLR